MTLVAIMMLQVRDGRPRAYIGCFVVHFAPCALEFIGEALPRPRPRHRVLWDLLSLSPLSFLPLRNETMAAQKIKVHFVPVGNAPLLKKSKFLMSSTDEFSVATTFLRKLLKLNSDGNTPLFLYINSFEPSADQSMGDLMDCFGVRGELVVHYSLMEAWG